METVKKLRCIILLAMLAGLFLVAVAAPAYAAQPKARIVASSEFPENPVIANANASIERAVEQARHLAESTPQDIDVIIIRLLDQVDQIVDRTVHALQGVELEFSYVEVQIGDRTVLVDPMKVAGG